MVKKGYFFPGSEGLKHTEAQTQWESAATIARSSGRTALAEARQRFRLLSQLEPLVSNKPAKQKS